MVLVKLVPLAKDRIPVQLRLSLREDVRIVTSGAPRTFTRHVSSVAIPVTFKPPSPAADSREERPGADEAGPSTLRASDITPYEEEEGDVTVTASDPGPFELPIPAKTLPTYRNALITVRHHIDFLVQFAAPDSASPSPISPSTTTNTTTSPGNRTPTPPRTTKFHPESCRVSMGLRILSHHLLPSARIATLENRTALFGPLPSLMLLSERDNTSSEDGTGGEDGSGGMGLPSYADHVADAIPQLVPLVDPGRLALGMGGLGMGMAGGGGVDTITGLSTIGGNDAMGMHRLNSASVLALGSIAADLGYDLDAEEVRELGLAQTGTGNGNGYLMPPPSVFGGGRSTRGSMESRNTTRTAGTDAQQARRLALMSRVPDYGAAVSVGGTAGIVPLSSSRELPSYADSQAQSREGSVRRGPLARARATETV